ncbi:anthranilate synthase component I [uncultured Clostridium sp.]|uniref:anthranilate synthase component I n=1 Tax=uncultured Clostridium sp. TaxID=59620 RepID=UPI0025F12140|nr:anthranilate synthase component I [uncultured Clostridium sp.]
MDIEVLYLGEDKKLSYKLLNGDEETPITLFKRLKGQNKVILESALGGRYSILASNPYKKVKSYGNKIEITTKNKVEVLEKDILSFLEEEIEFDVKTYEKFPFLGGALGYIGYDEKATYEKVKFNNLDTLGVPKSYLMFYEKFIIFDHYFNNYYLCIVTDINEDVADEDFSFISKDNVYTEKKSISEENDFTSNMTKDSFKNMVSKCKEYIVRGDVFQVVPSQRITKKYVKDEFSIYRKLRRTNPSPYMFYMDFEEFKIVGSSPERLVKVSDGIVSTNPIAGTRPRGINPEEDLKLEEELKNDEKERAEHLMLVDLGRNDIGKISEIGTVEVNKFMVIEKYKRVMHLVSEVKGKLKKDISKLDALKSIMPAGTLSGAPKVRAMEIIEELEPCARRIYGGAIGYFSNGGDFDTCIAIRTIIFKDGLAHVQGGAGIVYDSDEDKEYEESVNKARALLEVIQ